MKFVWFISSVLGQLLLLSDTTPEISCTEKNIVVDIDSIDTDLYDKQPFKAYYPSVEYDVDIHDLFKCETIDLQIRDQTEVEEKLLPLMTKNYVVAIKTFIPVLHVQKRQLATKPYSKRSLFQQYSFFNAAIFMGIFSMFIVGVISFWAMRMLLGLQTPTKFEVPAKK